MNEYIIAIGIFAAAVFIICLVNEYITKYWSKSDLEGDLREVEAFLGGKELIYYWFDGTWCDHEHFTQHKNVKGRNYYLLEVPLGIRKEEIDQMVEAALDERVRRNPNLVRLRKSGK